MADDFGSIIGAGNLGSVTVGGPAAAGSIEAANDRDWFAITLTSGQYYIFNLIGATLGDPAMSLLDPNGLALIGNDDISGANFNSQFSYVAGVTGTYYLEARGSSAADIGTYQVSAAINPAAPPTDDFGSQAGGFNVGALTVGGSVNGNIEANFDHDWFAITLTAGTSYVFDVTGSTLSDPAMHLRDSIGNSIAFNDDTNGTNPQIKYTATTTGTYYVDARGFGSGDVGTYTVSAAFDGAPPPPPSDDFDSAVGAPKLGTVTVGGTTNGTIDFGGDHDWFAVTLNAGSTYRITDTKGTLGDPRFTLRDSKGISVGGDDDSGGSLNAQLDFTPTTTGTYYIDANSSDGADTGTYTVGVTLLNAPPVITKNVGSSVNEGGLDTIAAAELQTTDANHGAAQLTYTISTATTRGTLFVDGNGNLIADVGEARGVGGTFTQADIDANRLRYAHDGSETTSDSFTFGVSDGTASVTGQVFAITVAPVNEQPTITNLAGNLAVYTELGSAVALDLGTDAVVADVDSANFDTGSLSVSLTAATANDGLSIASVGGISVTGNAVFSGATQFATFTGGGFGGGGLTFSFDADATPAAVQALIRAIRYDNNAGSNAAAGTRTVTWSLNDGDGNANGGNPLVVVGSQLQIVATNDAPVLDAGKSPVLASVLEDAGAPSGAVGTLVSSLVDNVSPAGGLDNVTDTDGPSVGIALTGTDTANGSWFYSINGGTTWNAMGVVSDGAARFLDGSARLYFQPNANFNGTIANSIAFRAWDGSTGSNGGLGSTSPNGGTSAFSTASDSASLTVTSVNDAPTSTGLSGNLAIYTEQGPAVALDVGGDATIADVDSANFDGGTLTVALSSSTANDSLFVQITGNNPGEIGGIGNAVTFGGTQFATFTGAGFGAGPLVFTFDADATPAAVQALIRAIRYGNNAGDKPAAGTRDVTWTLNDGDGNANGGNPLLTVTSQLRIDEVNDAPVANDDTYTIAEDTLLSIPIPPSELTKNDTDADGDTLIVISVSGATNGVQSVVGGNLVFTPTANFTGLASFNYTVSDGRGGFDTGKVNVTVTAQNDAPAIGGLANVGYTEQAPAITLAPALTLNDPDNANLTGANVTLSDAIAGDTLAVAGALPAGITLSAASTASSIVLTGTASVADYQAALRQITYANSSDNPTDGNTDDTRTVQFSATDGTATSTFGNVNVTITAVNDGPVNSVPTTTQTVSDTATLAFTSANGNLISVSDPDSGSSLIQVTLAPVGGSLTLQNGGPVTIASGGSTPFSGTVATLNNLLATAVFTPDPAANSATITVTTNDNGSTGTGGPKVDTDVINITITHNAAPVLDASKAPVLATILEDAGAPSGAVGTLVSALVDNVSPAGGLDNVTDADGPSLGIAITGVNAASGTLRYSTDGGTTWFAVGAVSNSSALLLSASTRLYFEPAANFNGTVSDALTFRAWDGFSGTATSGSTRGTADTTTNGNSTAFSAATDTAAITVTAVNDAPVVTTSGGIATFVEDGLPAVVDSGVTLADIDNATLASATVRITPGTYQAGQDLLSFANTNAALYGNVTGSFDSGTGFLTLVSAGSTATVAQWQNVFRTVAYSNSSDTPVTSNRQIEFVASDGTASSVVQSRQVAVVATNDAPVLDAAKAPVLATVLEDTGAPSGAVGTLVSSIVDNVSPAGGIDNVTDADGPSLGIAITGVNGTLGTLRYSTDSGTSWFDVGAVSASSALLLPGTARLHFEPFPNYNGTTADALTFRAWDRSSGTATSGSIRGTADTTTNGGATAFSAATDTAAITVTPVNDAPAILGFNMGGPEDTEINVQSVTFNFGPDTGQSVAGYIIVSLPATGTLTISGIPAVVGQEFADTSVLRYIPPANASGLPLTTFQIRLRDSGGTANGGVDLSAPFTVGINVTPVNDAPTNAVPASVTTNEDTVLAFSGLAAISVADIDVGAGNLNVTLTATNGTINISTLGGATIIGGNNSSPSMVLSGTPAAINAALSVLTYTPNANFNGAAQLTVFTSDLGNTGSGGALSASSIIPITVNPVNDAPAGADKTVTANEDTPYVFVAADFGFSDAADSPANALLAVRVTTLPATGTLRLDGIAVTAGQSVSAIDIAAGKLAYTPPANANGAALSSFQFQVQDNGGTANGGVDLDQSANVITIDVTAVNDAPVNTAPAAVTTNEDTPLAFTGGAKIAVGDIDGGAVTVSLGVTNGTLSLGTTGLTFTVGDGTADAAQTFSGKIADINAALASLTYTPAANYNGAATLTIVTNDGGQTGSGGPQSDTDTVTITVSPVNDVPVAPATQTVSIAEDTSSGPRAIGASDADGDVLTYSIKPGSGPSKGSLSFDQPAGTFTYNPVLNANGADAFVILISDGKGGVIEQAVQVSIAPVNDAPLANPDAFATLNGNPLSLSTAQLLANDGDIDGDPLVVQTVASATGGTVSMSGSTITFTPTAGFSGLGGFDYQISDTSGATAIARVTVTVGAGNRAPVVAGSQALTTIENADRTFTVAATDPDGDPLTFSATLPAHGTVSGGPGGVFTYQPTTGFSGTDSFTVAVSDGKGGNAFQSVTVNVIDVPEPTGFRLFTNAGWTGSIGGSGSVNGSNGHERVAVVDQAGTITFDGSFTRGNDVIVLAGNASAWQVMRLSGSAALLSDGDTFIQLAVGAGTAIQFADGVRNLAFDSGGTMAIGGQAITTSLATVSAAASGTAPGGDDPDAFARLFLSNGTTATAGGHLLVIGSNSAETLRLLGGEVQLDGSFTRGNDRLVFDFAANTYEASRTGAQLHLTGHGLDLTTPAGTGLLLDFTDSDRLLAFTGSQMTIGSQVITSNAQFLIG